MRAEPGAPTLPLSPPWFMSASVHCLPENGSLAFIGDEKRGCFEITEAQARRFLAAPNPHGKPNSDVVRPWAGTVDLLRAPRRRWIIDFPPDMEEREAGLYELPFAHVRRKVRPIWAGRREAWWVHGGPCGLSDRGFTGSRTCRGFARKVLRCSWWARVP